MPLRVLVVEDEFLIAMDLMDLIEEAGHVAIGSADTLESAVKLADQKQPDIATMDLRLKDQQSGAVVAKALLEKFGVRSVFVSGNLDANTRAQIDALDPIAYVGKPIAQHLLRRALDEAEHSKSQRRQTRPSPDS
ncbi:MAG: response regulator [Pseudomonadota bacterium]